MMKVIILAGGSGTRLWPYSRNDLPKQFLHFGEQYSLLQKTICRNLNLVSSSSDIVIITNQTYYHLVKAQIEQIDPTLRCTVLVEPERKNTAPAIALGFAYLLKVLHCDAKESVLISSSDHLISPEERYLEAIKRAEVWGDQGKHVIFGIRPHKPETGYGYIKASSNGKVERFVEKPNPILAQEYLLSGDYLWNAGVFLFQIQVFLEELKEHCPQIAEKLEGSFEEIIAHFSEMPDISIDYALMEKSTKTMLIPMDVTWSDVGSWDSVYDVFEKDEHANVMIGNVIDMGSKNCLVFGSKRLISTISLSDLLIIDTEDALLVGKKGESQKVKALVELLKRKNAKASLEHIMSHRPWGSYTVLEEGDRYKIKRITVDSMQKLSLQMHYHRSEHWVVVKGAAKVTVGEEEKLIHENESIFVPKGCVHRLENPGKVCLELIEVQVGEYVGEDDIVRLEDVYQRV